MRDSNERQVKMANQQDDPKGAGGLRRYQAYGTDGLCREHLRIWPVAVNRYALRYADLMNIVSDGHSGTKIELMYEFLRVKIEGHNLQEVIAVEFTRFCVALEQRD